MDTTKIREGLGCFVKSYLLIPHTEKNFIKDKKMVWRASSLVVQWFRLCLAMQGTQVPSLVREPTAHATAEARCRPMNTYFLAKKMWRVGLRLVVRQAQGALMWFLMRLLKNII